jgi:hypothetical protein
MLGNYRVSKQLKISRVVLSSMELVTQYVSISEYGSHISPVGILDSQNDITTIVMQYCYLSVSSFIL